jgi:pimeloyl-ACP methyl ester carboxylesterase
VHFRLRVAVSAACLALLGPLAVTGAAEAAAPDVTSAVEAARVDRVPTPDLAWTPCHGHAECASVRLPLDYDQPAGATTRVGLLRLKARDPGRRLGSLFVNPGGPGGSATDIALRARSLLTPELLDRFDIVGMDPRGIGTSEQLRCFATPADQAAVLRPLYGPGFPFRPAQEARAIEAARAFGQACSTTGRPLAAAMSTGQVARDMDVVRRAVGDRRLTFLGLSYGSYLGQVYANLFPDRVRAVAIDGVLDPLAWTGNAATWTTPVTQRLRSAEGAYAALREILRRCDDAGRQRCAFAGGDPMRKLEVIADRLKAAPLLIEDPSGAFRYSYATLVQSLQSYLYIEQGYVPITAELAALYDLTDPARTGAAADSPAALGLAASARARARYENSVETFSGVLCSDSVNPVDASAWAVAADRGAPYFNRFRVWQSVQCASGSWKAQDEDAYRGPFTRRTASPVLVVGNYWDPATNYEGAVTAARLLPHSVLLSSDSWGHTAYGTSSCVTGAISRYLLSSSTPPPGTRCVGDVQPFEPVPPQAGSQRFPVLPLLPPSTEPDVAAAALAG